MEGGPGEAGLDVLCFGDDTLGGADLDEVGLEDVGLVSLLKKLVIRFLSALTHNGILKNEGKDNCRSKVACE